MAWPWSSDDDKDDGGKDYISHRDGSTTEIERKGEKTNYYNYSKDDMYENDEDKRDHGHVVIRPDDNGRERVAYVRNGHGDSRNFDKDWDKGDDSSSKSSGGNCYIATASLQGSMSVEVLEPLKEWRYTVLERSPFGFRLSSYYRRTAPRIAEEVAHMPRVSAILRSVIVKPAIGLAMRPPSFINNLALFFLFMIGLSIAEVIKATTRR